MVNNNFDIDNYSIINEIERGYISHAYLIDENNNDNSFNIVLSFVKKILCLGLSDRECENLCKRIDDDNYPEFKIIEPDGMLIKKQQIIDLQRDFSMNAVEGTRRIYIIRDCEKMRPETANSMLKFLEEPDCNVTAFLITNNIDSVLTTIISRCQIIKLRNNNIKEKDVELNNMALSFIYNIENNGRRSIIENEKILTDVISLKDREKLIIFIDKLIDLYYNLMKIIISNSLNEEVSYYEELVKFTTNNSVSSITNKINCLVDCKDSIKYNVNVNLLIDKLIMSIGG